MSREGLNWDGNAYWSSQCVWGGTSCLPVLLLMEEWLPRKPDGQSALCMSCGILTPPSALPWLTLMCYSPPMSLLLHQCSEFWDDLWHYVGCYTCTSVDCLINIAAASTSHFSGAAMGKTFHIYYWFCLLLLATLWSRCFTVSLLKKFIFLF